MALIVSAVGLILIVVILFDGFEAMVLPRRVTRRFRPRAGFIACPGPSAGGWRPCCPPASGATIS